MHLLTWIAGGLAAWTCAALPFAVVLGRHVDRHQRGDDVRRPVAVLDAGSHAA
ncbi:hypothetical protein K8Z61_10620 [Nocardioides sp. TRM66260-LWL]|uniref:hypothetical protein n=1 Tax=Nocardioides sp. TRM66260-LWL TaxID=2874478 RepID=UPI001CC6E1DB|nr:hypothetical protein [Nocardioides sp. TRM66260-LWL]MBZ5734950.1 hypothetical protein [Nocardioides sp. TRM66260-LWL]